MLQVAEELQVAGVFLPLLRHDSARLRALGI